MKRTIFICFLIAIAITFSYCTTVNEGWLWRYSYLEELYSCAESAPQFTPQGEYFLVVLVDARHADYSSSRAYLSTLTSSMIRERSPDPGHAWIVLAGIKDGEPWIFEGGHSVDCNLLTKNYIKNILGLSSHGKEKNPARYLFQRTKNGLFEYGRGDNIPTFAAAIPLTKEGFDRILKLFEEDGYDFSKWGIEGPNCVQFALSCLASVGIEFDCEDALPVPPALSFFGNEFRLWSDPSHATLTIKTPDLLEKRLWELVKQGSAICATQWYGNFRDVLEKGYLETAELPAYPKPEEPDRPPTATVDIRGAELPHTIHEDVILLE
jgi:hypothetical protein